MKKKCLPLLLLLLFIQIHNTQAQDPVYKNPDASVEERVEDLLERMAVDEKIGQMTQLNITMINTTGNQADVVLVEEKARDLIANHHIGSFLNGEAVPPEEWHEFMTRLTRLAVEENRLGIPIIYGIDHVHGANYLSGSTVFPQAINLGATFNPAHSYNTGRITAFETAGLGHHWNFAPILDLGVNPLWPRLYETYGEDPHLAAKMGESYIRGYQENEDIVPYKTAATAKHFLGYSDPKSGWDRSPAYIPMQTIHEFHRPPFQAAVDAGVKTVMLNSGEINGVPVHGSHELLTGLLRDQMGFDGVILTDWADIEKMYNFHRVSENYKEATYRAIRAGVDMSMTPVSLDFNEAMKELVDEGRITEERLDESVRRILRLKFELGLFENPYPPEGMFNRIGRDENKAKALEAARESIVLLKNENTVLPAENPDHIILAGPTADNKRNLSGGWTLAWQGGDEGDYPDEMLTILEALHNEFPDATIEHVGDISTAENLNQADLIVYAGGEEPYAEFIGNITDLTLPKNQLDDIELVSGSQTPVVLVLVQGRPRIITPVADNAEAILFAGLPGFEGAEAIANVISGRVNPSGKMSISYPMHTGHFIPYNHKSSDVYFFDADEANQIVQENTSTALFPFGYGLSYTTFEYSGLNLSSGRIGEDEEITAEVTITNSGDRTGMESVLWFISDHVGSITRPVKELKHFEKVELAPGESKTVQFTINPHEELTFPDENGQTLLEQGSFTLQAGDLSKDFYLDLGESE